MATTHCLDLMYAGESMADFPLTVEERNKCLKEGRPVRFPEAMPDGMLPNDWQSLRTIHAAEIVSEVDPVTRSLAVSVDIHNAIIADELNLGYVATQGDFFIRKSQFQGVVNLCNAKFGGVVDFSESVFTHPVKATAANFNSDLRLMRATFRSTGEFEALEVSGRLDARGTEFQEVTFRSARFGKMAIFGPYDEPAHDQVPARATGVVFAGNANFREVRFEGSAVFEGVTCRKALDLTRATIGAGLFFRSRVAQDLPRVLLRCEEHVTFLDVSVFAAADLNGANFVRGATFTRMHAGSGIFCGAVSADKINWVRAEFGADTYFRGMQIAGDAYFSGAQFNGECDFEDAKIKGNAYFAAVWNTEVRFRVFGRARFRGMLVEGIGDFSGAQFDGEVTFDRSQFGSNLYLLAQTDPQLLRTTFRGQASFNDVQIKGSIFAAGASFRETSFRRMQVQGNAYFGAQEPHLGVDFSEPAYFREVRIGGTLDCIGAHFNVVSWDRTSIGGSAFFKSVPDRACILRDASFMDVEIKGAANFYQAQFAGNTWFDRMRVGSALLLQQTRFAGPLSAMDAQVQVANFGESTKERAELPERVNFQGFVFGRFVGDWQWFVNLLPPDQPQGPIFVRIEQLYREAGEEKEADLIYVARKKRDKADLIREIEHGPPPGIPATKRLKYRRWENAVLHRCFYYGLPCWRHVWLATALMLITFVLTLGADAIEPKKGVPPAPTRRERVYASAGVALTNLIPGEKATELSSWEVSSTHKPLPGGWTYKQWMAALRYTIYALLGIGAAQLATLTKRHSG